MTSEGDRAFAGSIPEIYQSHLVPLLFEPYAEDLTARLASRPLTRLLEIAAGTGAVTRRLAAALPEQVSIVATDLNQPMLDVAAGIGTARPVEWRAADALDLPFGDASFDAVVCQFGVMFFPDRPKAYSEARRVLRPGGVFLFNAWDELEANDLSAIVSASVAALFPDDPPGFLARTPYAYHDPSTIRRDLEQGGFSGPIDISTLTQRGRAPSARAAAVALVQGTPLRSEIEARDPARVAEATDLAERAIAQRFGTGPVDSRIQALVAQAAMLPKRSASQRSPSSSGGPM